MGNAPYTISSNVQTPGLVGKVQRFTVELTTPAAVKDVRGVLLSPVGDRQRLSKQYDAASTMYTFTYVPPAAGMYTIKLRFVYADGETGRETETKQCRIFHTDHDRDAFLRAEEVHKLAQQKRDAEEKMRTMQLALEAQRSGGIFSTDLRFDSVDDLPEEFEFQLKRRVGGKARLATRINHQDYLVSLSALQPDHDAQRALQRNWSRFASFPDEESRRPTQDWPLDMPLAVVVKGACEMTDPYALKNLLARGVDPNLDLGWGHTPLSKVAGCGPAKDPTKWKTEHGVSRNFSSDAVSPKFHTYRQSRECDAVACAIILLQGGAQITNKVKEEADTDSFFAKGVPRVRLKRVLEAFENGTAKDIDWTTAFQALDDLNAPWPPPAPGPGPGPTASTDAAVAVIVSNGPPFGGKDEEPRYWERHHLRELFEEMLAEVLVHQPNEVVQHLIDWLRGARDHGTPVAPPQGQLQERKVHNASAAIASGSIVGQADRMSRRVMNKKEAGALILSIMENKKRSVEPSTQQLEALWTHYDTDSNGILDAKECLALLQDMQNTSRQRLRDEREANRDNPMVLAILGMVEKQLDAAAVNTADHETVTRLLSRLDANADGKVTRQEFLSGGGRYVFGDDVFSGADESPELEVEQAAELMGAMIGGMLVAAMMNEESEDDDDGYAASTDDESDDGNTTPQCKMQ